MTRHEVRQGENVRSIAWAHGVPWEEVWNHPDNEALKEARVDPHSLLPGDVLFVPEPRPRDESVPLDRRTTFRIREVPFHLHLRLLDLEGPRAKVAYEIDLGVEHALISGTTDGNGWIHEPIPPRVRRARLALATGEEYELLIRELDPPDSPRGAQSRLAGLGKYLGAVDGDLGVATVMAIRTFQDEQGFEPSGELDVDTVDALRREYGG